jgi:hypothetical protein
VLTATAGEFSAGIGGRYAGSAGTITISGGTVTANGGLNAAGIGGGFKGSGGTVTISGGTVTATGDTRGTGGSAIGPGAFDSTFGSLTNAGTLTLKGNETPPGSAAATNKTAGAIHLDTELHGGGILINEGTILPGTGLLVTGGWVTGVNVTDHDYVVTYTVSGTPVTQQKFQTVYAASFKAGGVALPTVPGYAWSESGGQQVTGTTDLTTLFGDTTGPTSITLYAKAAIAVTTVGGSQNFGSSTPTFTGTYTEPTGRWSRAPSPALR